MTGTLLLAAGLVIGAAVVWMMLRSPASPVTRGVVRFSIRPPATALVGQQQGPDIAISPDGRLIVYVSELGGAYQLYLHRIDELEVRAE